MYQAHLIVHSQGENTPISDPNTTNYCTSCEPLLNKVPVRPEHTFTPQQLAAVAPSSLPPSYVPSRQVCNTTTTTSTVYERTSFKIGGEVLEWGKRNWNIRDPFDMLNYMTPKLRATNASSMLWQETEDGINGITT